MSSGCRICGGKLHEFLDMGKQPSANGFIDPAETSDEFQFRLALGTCVGCGMVQLVEEVPQERRYHENYRYHASGSVLHRRHFENEAGRLLGAELNGSDPFIVEIGCNDGVLLSTVAEAGIRHLGVDPSTNVVELARSRGVRAVTEFFDAGLGESLRDEHGHADVIFGANTICHIAHIDSLFRGVDALLAPSGVFVFEEPYLGTVLDHKAFDQIYDEHVFYFGVASVAAMAERFGFELVDVERTPLHGGEIRYTLARRGARSVRDSVGALLAEEQAAGITDPGTWRRFGLEIDNIREELTRLLRRLSSEGRRVVGYGAPGKTSTVTNYCGIDSDLLPFVCDSTRSKQGLLIPGSHIPVLPPEAFSNPYPDYALMFAWNHADEIMAKESEFTASGGHWIRYVPEVRID
ncbi:methylation protein EvaC [Actinopolyspora mzabensis]|uniref:Methylation protein EvaC n=1 Tax=Actinopolyspora mzabensis TaxID=995066 RepID=A0A1G8Y419_ACTMZ|nr:class I SAM-dependent methyltransferase [Actinopolyspora mzabensis]SDJ97531.1 methylation protein EvaC [Actinopolyspora mzabensis]